MKCYKDGIHYYKVINDDQMISFTNFEDHPEIKVVGIGNIKGDYSLIKGAKVIGIQEFNEAFDTVLKRILHINRQEWK